MRKLTAAQSKEWEEKVENVTDALDTLNEMLSGMAIFIANRLSDMEAYESERSDAWQDSEGAEAWHEWQEQWQEAANEIDNLEFDGITTAISLPEGVE